MRQTKKGNLFFKFFQIGTFLLLIAAIIFSTASGNAGEWMESYRYPREYRAHVEQYASLYGVEPNLVYAIIKAESGFSPSVVSRAGAIGLMQITPERFAEICTDIQGVELKDAGLLYDPMTNLDAGCAWLSYLYRYYGIWEHAHAAYYVGTETVDAWLSIPDYLNENGILTEIPDEAVAAYVRDVQKATEYYQKLYYAP